MHHTLKDALKTFHSSADDFDCGLRLQHDPTYGWDGSASMIFDEMIEVVTADPLLTAVLIVYRDGGYQVHSGTLENVGDMQHVRLNRRYFEPLVLDREFLRALAI